jgi:DNA helicase-2/ATP-dependent DNA helicase PcrA
VILAPDHKPTAVTVATQRVGNLLGMTMDRPASEGGPRPVRPADIAVLVRTNTEVGQWVKHLEEAGIPARSDTGISHLSQPEIVGMYRFLQLLARYPDDVALVEALSTAHFEGIDVRAEEKRLLAYGFERGRPLTDEYERNHGPHARVVRELLHKSRTVTIPQLLGLVEEAFQLKHRYREQGLDSAAVNLDRLRDYARNRFNDDQALTLRTFLDMLHRDIMNDTEMRDAAEQETEGEGQITVMTVHRSKGLEFPIVIVPGIAEERLKSAIPEFVPHKNYGLELNVKDLGVFPSAALKDEWRAMQQHLLAEEMRLFYVAVTRAKHMVCMFGVQLQPGDERSDARSWQAEVLAARVEMERCGAEFCPNGTADASKPGLTDEPDASAETVERSDVTSGLEPVAEVW